MNAEIGYKYVCLYKKEREIRTTTKFAWDEMRSPGTPDIYIRLF
jgi:hypothetical protein